MYLTDIVKIAIDSELRVDSFTGASSNEVLGVNSRDELAAAERYLQGG